jgi:hypothetical protein
MTNYDLYLAMTALTAVWFVFSYVLRWAVERSR